MDYFHETIRTPDRFLAWAYFQQENDIHNVKKHWHRSIEMSYVVKGSCLFNVNGEEFEAKKDDMVLINSCDVHGVLTNYLGESDMLCIIFPYSFLKAVYPEFVRYRYEPEAFPEACARLKQDFRDIIPVFKGREGNPLYQLKMNSFFYDVIYILFAECRVTKPAAASIRTEKHIERCTQLLDYIDSHYMDALSLEKMAEEFSLSKEHLSRTFKMYMDTTFKKYLTSVRLHHAYQDIVDSDLPILQIAVNNGFSDARAFNNAFYAIYGQTPLKYRKSMEDEDLSHQKRKYLRTHGYL